MRFFFLYLICIRVALQYSRVPFAMPIINMSKQRLPKTLRESDMFDYLLENKLTIENNLNLYDGLQYGPVPKEVYDNLVPQIITAVFLFSRVKTPD